LIAVNYADEQLGSGLLLASYTAHYRAVTSHTFTNDSNLLLSASLDASVHVYVVSRLVDEDDSGAVGKPYGTLSDHTLGIRAVAVGRTAGSSGGRCWTASDDGTVKVGLLAFYGGMAAWRHAANQLRCGRCTLHSTCSLRLAFRHL
jgi:WD40 repeat protein